MFKKEITKMILILLIVNMYLQAKEKFYTDKNGNSGDQGSTDLEMHKKSVDKKNDKKKSKAITKYLEGGEGRTEKDAVCCKYTTGLDTKFKETGVTSY